MAARVLVAGASGYIGSHVVAELLRQGYQVVALLRPDSDWHLEHPDLELVRAELTGSGVWFADLKACSQVVSCLASRTGGPDDARRVEYDANMAVLAAAQHWGATRFLLLSAICVQNRGWLSSGKSCALKRPCNNPVCPGRLSERLLSSNPCQARSSGSGTASLFLYSATAHKQPVNPSPSRTSRRT